MSMIEKIVCAKCTCTVYMYEPFSNGTYGPRLRNNNGIVTNAMVNVVYFDKKGINAFNSQRSECYCLECFCLMFGESYATTNFVDYKQYDNLVITCCCENVTTALFHCKNTEVQIYIHQLYDEEKIKKAYYKTQQLIFAHRKCKKCWELENSK